MEALKTEIITWPVAGSFKISRSALTEIPVVVVTITKNGKIGRGECRPYARYNENPTSVCEQIKSLEAELSSLNLENLQTRLGAGAARNAVDCALWDLEAQLQNTSVSKLLKLPAPKARDTAFTLSLDTPENMANAAKAALQYNLLKIKIGSNDGLKSALAVMEQRPDAQLIIDANEALDEDAMKKFQTALTSKPVALIEQPMPATQKLPFATANRRPVICADEALHTRNDLQRLWHEGYRAVNIKLDKAGGLTEALALTQTAKEMGFIIMLGCMVGSSLAMAPALLLESYADIIDLDGAALLARDHSDGVSYKDGKIWPAPNHFWGHSRA